MKAQEKLVNSSMQQAAAHWLEGGRLISGLPQDAFPFLGERGHVVSLVGGGGKTTLMYHLAQVSQARGLRTAVMTTTKIGRPGPYCRSMAACMACWAAGEYAVCGERLGDLREMVHQRRLSAAANQ